MTSSGKFGSFQPALLWAVHRYPLPILASFLATVWLLLCEFNRPFVREFFSYGEETKVTASLISAFLAATTAEFATARLGLWRRWGAQGAAFLLGLCIVLWFDTRHLPATALPFVIALICFMSLAAGLAAQRGAIGFWLANARLALTLKFGAVALAIAVLGGGTILASVEALLGVETRKTGTVLFIVACWFLVPLFWLSLARFNDLRPAKGNVLLRILATGTDALLTPLMLVFAAVIHLYAARIAILSELPKGQIGWIVPVYLLAGYATFLLSYGPEALLPRVRALFNRSWVWATLIPLVLLGLATAQRVQAYGWTEGRYTLALITIGGILLAAVTLIRRPLDIRLSRSWRGRWRLQWRLARSVR